MHTRAWLLVIAALATPAVSATAAEAPVLVRVKNFVVSPSTGPATGVIVRNRLGGPYKGTLAVKFPEGWKVTPDKHALALAAGETREYPFAIESASDRAANSYPVEITVEGSAGRTVSKQQVVCASAPYLKPQIDGDLKEWKDSIPITFTTRGKKTVVMTYWNKRRFCLAVEVEEDKLVGYEDRSAGSGMDAIQFALAKANAKTGAEVTENSARFEFLVAATGADRSSGKCFSLLKPGSALGLCKEQRALEALLTDGAEVAVARSGGVTRYELSIPFKPMRSLRPTPGREFCFSLLVHDPDGTGVRDLGDVMNMWESERPPLAWCSWRGVKWGDARPFDGKIEFGFCSSIH